MKYKISAFFVGLIITFLTSISLIYFDIPQIIYGNIIGIMIISYVLGGTAGVVFSVVVSVVKVRFGLSYEILNYMCFINICEAIFIGIIRKSNLKVEIKFFIMALLLTLLIRPLAIGLFDFFGYSKTNIEILGILEQYFNTKLLIYFAIYSFSGLVTYFFVKIFNILGFEEEKFNGFKQEKIS